MQQTIYNNDKRKTQLIDTLTFFKAFIQHTFKHSLLRVQRSNLMKRTKSLPSTRNKQMAALQHV